MQTFPADVQERIRAFLHPWRVYLASREWAERAAMLWEDHKDPTGFTDPDSDWTDHYDQDVGRGMARRSSFQNGGFIFNNKRSP